MREFLIVALGAALLAGCGGSTAQNDARPTASPLPIILGIPMATRNAAPTTIAAAPTVQLTGYPRPDVLKLLGVNATDVLHLPGWAVTAGDVADDATRFAHSQMAEDTCAMLDNQILIDMTSTLDSAKPEAIGNSVPDDLDLVRSIYEEGCVRAGFFPSEPTPTHLWGPRISSVSTQVKRPP
jgi:hypothetical protein